MARFNLFDSIYRFYTQDLSPNEFERLIKKEAPEVYEYYVGNIKEEDRGGNKFTRNIKFIINIIKAFLLKMSPVRRLIYSIAVVLFFYSAFVGDWFWAVLTFLVLNFLLALELAGKLTAKDELDLARKIQLDLMPQQPPKMERFQISSHMETANTVGGDYYDYFPVAGEKGKNLIFIGDISGKGMGAALYMVQVQALLHHFFQSFSGIKSIACELNKDLKLRLNAKDFFTSAMMLLNDAGSVEFCRCGHTPIVHYSSETNECAFLKSKGIGMGLVGNEIFEQHLETVSIEPKQGDVFVMYTDGVTEMMNPARVEFGEENLKRIVCANHEKNAADIRFEILNSLQLFRRDAKPQDDVTLVVIKVTG